MVKEDTFRDRHEAYAKSLRDWIRLEVACGRIEADVELTGGVEWLPYGDSDVADGPSLEIVGSYGLVEPEYAAIRRGAGIIDRPQRGLIRLRGADRVDFLNRMLTQELKNLQPGEASRAFWLSRKGRVESDLLVMATDQEVFLDVDGHQLKTTIDTLGSYVFTEDVEIEDVSESFHRLSMHGPMVSAVLGASSPTTSPVEATAVRKVTIGSALCVVAESDEIASGGVELILPADQAGEVWDALLATDESLGEGRRRVRPVGWFAYNMARIEGGTPLCNIDFGTTNLPHETGVLESRVSFTKGCYLGQEIVARMQSLGKPKQMLLGLRMEGSGLPVAGTQVFDVESPTGTPIGAVTSSTLSPMLGGASIGFAMIRTTHSEEGTRVLASADGEQVRATVTGLKFWPPESSG